MQTLNLVAPGGGQVTVQLPADAPVVGVSAGVRFAGGSFGAGLQIGPRGYHEFAVTHVTPARHRERLLVHGREVVVSEAVDGETSVATLIGKYHELMTVYAGPAPTRSRIFALFSSLRIVDRPAGMVVRPVAASLLDTMTEHLVLVVRDRGSVSIPGPRQAGLLVPRHAGAPTRHGEVWKAPYPTTAGSPRLRDHSYVVGYRRGLAEVHLTPTDRATEQQQLDWLNELHVAWRDGN